MCIRDSSKGIRDYEELDTMILAAAFEKAVETAYKAVMKPKEGTILTVACLLYTSYYQRSLVT